MYVHTCIHVQLLYKHVHISTSEVDLQEDVAVRGVVFDERGSEWRAGESSSLRGHH